MVANSPGWDILFISSVGYCEIHYDQRRGCNDMELNRGKCEANKTQEGDCSVVLSTSIHEIPRASDK